MSCMKCPHAHIPSHSPIPPHMPMPSVTTVTGCTNDTHILSPYRPTSTQCKCQWTTNPESILTAITQLEVYVLRVFLILGYKTFRITQQVSYTHTEFFGSHHGSLTPKVLGFHLRRLTTLFLLRPTHINLFSFVLFILYHHESQLDVVRFELTTHSLRIANLPFLCTHTRLDAMIL